MDTTNIPQLVFPIFDIPKQKDDILKYLEEHPKLPIQSEVLYDIIKTDNFGLIDFNSHVISLKSEGLLEFVVMSGDRKQLFITDKGRIFLKGGGFTQNAKDDFHNGFERLLEEKKNEKS